MKTTKREIAEKVRTRKMAQCGITAYYQHNIDINKKSFEKDQTGRVFVLSHDDPFGTVLHDCCRTKQQFIDIVYDDVNKED